MYVHLYALEYENRSDHWLLLVQREKTCKAEENSLKDKLKIIELKRKVCGDSDKGFVVINKGIDPP